MRIKERIKKSKLMKLSLMVDGEILEIDLSKELKIDDTTINKDLKEQPTSYFYLCSIRNRYIGILADQDDKIKEIKARLYPKLYEKLGTVKAAEIAVLKHSKYLKEKRKYQQLKINLNDLNDAVRSFEQRKDILQTLSANTRKQQ